MKKRDTGHQSVSLENKTGDSTVLKIGDSVKVMIKQDMKGRKHKYGFNNNKREKTEKKRMVDDETGDKHELYELPGSDWEDKLIDVYFNISSKLLDICNAFSSELSHLNQ
ncbi:hypothetical protein JHK87_052680 [Glycine soja]|nr:hypothetical protein JHK87_052680 [Glycine soja]